MTKPPNRIRPGARGGAYHRVSDLAGRDPDAENYQTEQQAWDDIGNWAALRKVTIAEYYCDRDQTGSKMSRPEFDRMVNDLASGVIDFIVINKVDRMSRAEVGSAMLKVKEIADIAPGGLAILDLGLDPATKMGEMVLTVLLALARMQWRGHQENWADVQSRAVARGVWIGPAPFGYDASVLGETPAGKVVHGPLVPNGDAPIVTQAFKLAAADGLHAAMRYLRREASQRRWRTYEVRKLLKSKVYLGEVKKGEHHKANAHPPLTNPTTYLAAQSEPRGRARNGAYVLSGLIYCHCGATMKGAVRGGRDGVKVRSMRCNQCNTSINCDLIEPYLRDALKRALATKRVRDAFAPVGVDEAREAWQDAEAEHDRYLTDLEARSLARSDEAWRAGLRVRAQDAEAKRDVYQSLVGQAEGYERLPLSDEMDDDEQFARALAILAKRAPVIVGAGHRPISERVGLKLDEVTRSSLDT